MSHAATPYAPPPAYVPLQPPHVADLLAQTPRFANALGGSLHEWIVTEVGDGNLNLVFIVRGPLGSLVVKQSSQQSLPYVRCVGTSWPLSAQRAFFEYQALEKEYSLVPKHVPEPMLFLPENAAFIMEHLSPHIILRKGLIKGIHYLHLADHMSTFMAETLYKTSDFSTPTEEKRSQVALYSHNHSLCALTEQVIFEEPYESAKNNSWTSPQLDDLAEVLRTDKALRDEILQLRFQFQTNTEALLHGDLHTGSIMVTETETKVIDPEFAFYGPMGFDIGAYIGNLVMAFFSQDGHATPDNDRADYKSYILVQIKETWNLFKAKFVALWTSSALPVYQANRAGNFQDLFMRKLLIDSIRFAAAKTLRRIYGIAHVEDFKAIENNDLRAACERKATLFSIHLLKNTGSITNVDQYIESIQSFA